MGLIISVVTQKGGVGKTTICNSLSATLNARGARVLCIDMDPQGNLSFSTGAETEESYTIYEALKGSVSDLTDIIQRRAMCDIIPSNILLSAIELEFTGENREFLLKNILRAVVNFYDYIIIDSPPGLGILTVNALAACDYVIIPMTPDIFSLQGLALVYDTIVHIQASVNPDIKVAGVLINRYISRSRLHQEVKGTAQMISQSLNIPLFDTVIRNSYSLSEAQSLQKDITQYAPRSAGVKDFSKFATELADMGIRASDVH